MNQLGLFFLEETMARIRFDRKTCEGFFVCSAGDPDDFEELTEEKKVNLTNGSEEKTAVWEKKIPGEGEHYEAAKLAALGCPVDAIQVFDDDGTLVAGPENLPIEASKPPSESAKPEAEEAAA